MTLLHEAVDEKKFDVRTVERNMARGSISHQEVEQNLTKLPDDGENATYTSLDALMSEGVPPVEGLNNRAAGESSGPATHH